MEEVIVEPGEGLPSQIFKERYARTAEETWVEACERVAEHIANAEDNGKRTVYKEKFAKELKSNRFMPGGRIWYGSGRSVAQLLNCFVVPGHDSREGWGKLLYDTCVISGTGGGIGANFSDVRGRGFAIKGTGGVSTGAVSLMKMQDSISNELRQGGGRRAALMQCLNVNHPDILEFLEVKLDKGELNNANISIVMNIDSEEFANKVKNDEDIELEFNGLKTGETVSAKWLWNKLIENAYNSGDPGILNGYFANKMNNISYYESLISTNPCGEIWLGAYDCCCLGNLVLPRFVVDGKFDWDQFDETVRIGVRFLDNVLTINDFPLPEIKEKCHYNRRVGLGVMGLHTMLLELGLTYGSEEGLAFIDKLFHIMKNTSYDESITLAAEKGPFPGYRPDFLKSNFVKGLKPALRNKIKHHGIRNCALLTVPPTGTTSMVSGNGVSSGIESLFAPAYYRRVRASDEMGRDYYYQELVITDEYKKFGELAVGAYDITLDDHLKTQAVIQKHIDNAVSKTINIPAEFPMEDLKDKLLEYLPHVKGMTIYRQGSKGLEPLEHIPVDKVKELLAEEHAKGNIEDQSIMDCVSGVCTI